jgi:formylglycine-generating enzyme required for sulfatase activity
MICDRYPYGRRIGGKEEDELVEWLGTELVVVRADWFAFAASRPPLYHDLLGLPGSDGGHGADLVLEKELGVDVSANILARRNVARAGIRDKQSGVSQHNRLIERHERRTGHYYWKSYDFQDSVGPSNLVLRPLGPSSVELPANQIDFVFSHAGGEIIFDLPNGLQGYLLVDADGRRLDDGPAKIVYDRDNSAEVVGQITNGISCIACHAGGINPKLDQIRDGALKVLPRTLRDEFEALYPPNDAMARLQESDRARFRAAMRKIDPNHACDDSLCEPVRQMSVRFLENLTFERAAAEFGVEPKAFEVAFGGRGRASFTQLSAGAMSRAEFVRVFKDIVADNASEFGEVSGCGSAAEIPVSPASPKSTTDTRPRPSPTKAIWNANWDAEVVRQDPDPAVVTDAAGRARMIATRLPWKVRDRKTGIVMLLCPPGEFVMGSPVDEQGRGSNERQREVSIEQAFYLSEAEVTQAQWARVMEKNPSRGEGLGNPVNSVFWSECQSFCQLSGLRLPSEVEWEFACRAGTTGAYAGDLKSMGWFNDGSGGAKEHPVKQKLPNPWGFYDMHGNVIEWCQDTYDLNAVGTQAAASANSPAHVIRGGGWFQRSDECRSASRDSYSDRRREVMFGFRVARTPG